MLFKIHIEIERWKYNKNYNLYVSNLGNFKDKNKKDISPFVDKSGYLRIGVCNNKRNEIKYLQAHRVVMETWCPKKNMWTDKLTVDHLDHNKRNNKIKNLEWVTLEENLNRAAKDSICLDLESENQRLKSRVHNLEEQLLNKKVKIILKNLNNEIIKTCVGWLEVYSVLKESGFNMNDINVATLRERGTKAADKHRFYFGYYWEII